MNISIRSGLLWLLGLLAVAALLDTISSHPTAETNLPVPEAGKQLDFNKPIYLKEASVACIDPVDLQRLPFEADGFDKLDAGQYYRSCLEWSARRVKVLSRKGEILNVVDADLLNPAGQDAWVLEDTLHN